jgi:hypothetical protein
MATFSLNWSLSHIVRLFIRNVCTWLSAMLCRHLIEVDLKRPENKSNSNQILIAYQIYFPPKGLGFRNLKGAAFEITEIAFESYEPLVV